MKLINPLLTVQNTDQAYWLVRMQHQVSENEHIDVELKVKRSDVPVSELQMQLLRQARDLLDKMLSS